MGDSETQVYKLITDNTPAAFITKVVREYLFGYIVLFGAINETWVGYLIFPVRHSAEDNILSANTSLQEKKYN